MVYLDDGFTVQSKPTLLIDGVAQTNQFFEKLTPRTIYRLSVAAVNGAGEGPRSDRLTLIASDYPTEPLNVMAVLQSREQIDIQWQEPTLVGAAGMTGYKIYADNG